MSDKPRCGEYSDKEESGLCRKPAKFSYKLGGALELLFCAEHRHRIITHVDKSEYKASNWRALK